MEQKFWITDAVIAKRSTAGELAKQLSLPRRLLHRLVSHARKDKVMKGSNGRPSALDVDAHAQIQHHIQQRTRCGGQISADEISAMISSKARETAERRRSESNLQGMSKRSTKRYLDFFLAYQEALRHPQSQQH
jgi:hypothetical protein